MSLKDLFVFSKRRMHKIESKDDAKTAIAYMAQSANMASHMPNANAIITNLRDPDEEICRFELQELEAVLTGRKEPVDEER